MRTISQKELKEILDKHKKWLNDEAGGEKAKLRYVYLQGFDLQYADLRGADLQFTKLQGADLRGANLQLADLRYANLRYASLWEANLRDADMYNADLQKAYRPWLVYVGNLGSRRSEIVYFADYDNVRYGDWNDYLGGTLAEFKKRIDKVYPADSENEEYQRYRIEYLSAIKLFESMREAYLKSAEKEKDND